MPSGHRARRQWRPLRRAAGEWRAAGHAPAGYRGACAVDEWTLPNPEPLSFPHRAYTSIAWTMRSCVWATPTWWDSAACVAQLQAPRHARAMSLPAIHSADVAFGTPCVAGHRQGVS